METTLHLRPNLSWHDGTPFSAEDFVFGWRVYATNQTAEELSVEQAVLAYREEYLIEPFVADYRFRRADGEYVWVHDEAVLVPSTDGDAFWQGFLFDITAHLGDHCELRFESYRAGIPR